jgi:hypothetical protein
MTLYYMATIDIRTIKFLLDTNIPNKEIIPLTKSILYQPQMNTGKWNEYPFLPWMLNIPNYIYQHSHTNNRWSFFIKQKMIEILRTKSNITENQIVLS